MEQKERKQYVKRWNAHINDLNVLGMNPNRELSKRIFAITEELKELVPKIADEKIKV